MTRQTPALDELAEKQAAIDKAEERVAELEAEGRAASREADDSVADLEDYYRQLGAGECAPDPARERKLKAAVREADDELTAVPVANLRAEEDDPYDLQVVNRRIEGMLAGAHQALEQAEQDYDQFIRTRFDDLATELGAEGGALVRRYKAPWQKLREAEEEWKEHKERWRPLIERSGLSFSFPSSPLSGKREMDPPVPQALLKGEKFEKPGRTRKRRAAA